VAATGSKEWARLGVLARHATERAMAATRATVKATFGELIALAPGGRTRGAPVCKLLGGPRTL